MLVAKKILKILRDYCENTSLVGLGYISNSKIHLTERIFWLLCIIVSAAGSYYLIREYQNDFESKAISMVIEGTKPEDKTQFPAIGVCEAGGPITKYTQLINFVTKLCKEKGTNEYSYDIDDFIMRISFPNMYSPGSLLQYCKPYTDCPSCPQCPTSGYKEIAALVRENCSELILNCRWNEKPFNCCDYFLPLQTPNGKCFIMNSLQTTTRDSSNWLNTEIDWDDGYGELQLQFSKPTQVNLLNAEDIPFFLAQDNMFDLEHHGKGQDLQLSVQNIINDPDIRAISPEYRKCRFPDENFENSAYEYYSYTTCVSDCLKKVQLLTCGCTGNDKTSPCDYDGFICLDEADLLRPRRSIMQPWRSNGLVCKCLPSCTEHEIRVFEESSIARTNATRQIKIKQSVATQQFRRQAVRTRLDVVVTIGGILGLFMGASILSGIEILYFFLIRVFNLRN